MKTYEVTLSNGKTYEFDADEGMSPDQASQAFMAEFVKMQAPKDEPAERSVSNPLWGTVAGAGHNVLSLGRGIKDWFVDPSSKDMEDRRMELEGLSRLRKEHPMATFAGEVAPDLAAGGLAGVGRGILGTMARQGAVSGGMAGARPGTMEERAKAAALEGGAAAAGAGIIGKAAEKGGDLYRHMTRPDIQMLRAEGVTPTVGQTLGGTANEWEQKVASSVPILGDAAKHARNRAMDQWQRAELNRAVAPAGGRIEGIGQSGVDEAQQIKHAAYDDMVSRAPGGIPVDQKMRQEIGMLRQVIKRNAKAETVKAFDDFYNNNLKRRWGTTPGMEVRNFKELDSDIGKRIAGEADKQTRDAFRELQRILRTGAGRTAPDYEEARKIADPIHERLTNIEKATTVAPGQTGNMTPTQLLRQQRDSNRRYSGNVHKFAAGQANGQDFTTAAQNVLGNRVPDSGTAGRLGLPGGLAAGAASPAAAVTGLATGLGGWVGATEPMQRGITSGIRGAAYGASNLPPWLVQMLDVQNEEAETP